MTERDDFSAKTKRHLALRASYLCSFTGCPQHTVGPSDESSFAVTNIGVAAHICAASKGGKRYLQSMTLEERLHIDNGIWLCQTHAALIDRDERTYTIECLREMKRIHEAECAERVKNRTGGAPYVGDLIGFGPAIVCIGEVREVDGSAWTLLLKHFVMGDFSALAAFVGGFSTFPRDDQNVLVNELDDGRVLSAAPILTKAEGGYIIRCPVAPSFPRVAAQELGSQWAISMKTNDLYLDPKTRQIARVSGIDSLAQVIRQTLSLQRGEMLYDPGYGARLVEYFDQFRNSPWLERLLKLEVIRSAAIPYIGALTKRESTPLHCVERVYKIELLANDPTNEWLPIRVDFEVKGIGRWQHDLSILMPSPVTQAKIRDRQSSFERLHGPNPRR